ncbi:DUF559 domain-containing protein [Pseudoxanthomonas sp. CF125]|uniref:endonuclease domain-containing protein n=1 Tax=Pseudoxanthomonas sp. CF125 TaxID=1855303 RepID=UPI00087E773C|nr:DUF559 domain-containing protein [Pseudoxanthomonas sp. CF125]SDQ42975.1 Protein of unknown function [Pseudoxanthomonas sp. CF125]
MSVWDHLRRTCEPPSELIEVPEDARRVFNQAMGAWIAGDAHGFWLEPETGDGHCNPEQFTITIAQRLSALSEAYNAADTGSPIEDQMLGALLWLYMDWAEFPKIDFINGPADHKKQFGDTEHLEFWITPQAEIGGYKADFLVWFKLKNKVGGLAIECDGHAFHEKTKEQASRDKARDRAFITAGFPALRFSGSDIFRDPLNCLEQIKLALDPVLDRVSKEGGLY